MRRVCGLVAVLVALGVALASASPAGAAFPGANGFVVFQSNRDGDYDLFAQNRDGTSLRKLVNRPGTDEFNAGWNPRGTRLVFQSQPTNGSDSDLYLVNADGTGLAPLLVGPTFDRAPQFCDADTVVFQRNVAGVGDIYAIETNGTGLRRLTDHPANDSTPTCSPDGATVAFISSRGGGPSIYSVPLASAAPARALSLAEPALLVANAVDPDYSPSGSRLAYSSNDANNTEVFVKDLATGSVRQITTSNPPAANRLPKFLPGQPPESAGRGPAGSIDLGDIDLAIFTLILSGQDIEDVKSNSVPCPNAARPAGTLADIADFCLAAITDAGAAVVQPIPPKCQCKNLTVGIPKKSVGSGQVSSGGASLTRLFFDVAWDLTCSAGLGTTCKGQLELLPPPGFTINSMRRVTRKGGKVVLNPVATDRAVDCKGNCSLTADTTTAGTFRLAVNSPLTKAQLAGSRQTFRIETTCAGNRTTTTIVIAFAASGKVKSVTVRH